AAVDQSDAGSQRLPDRNAHNVERVQARDYKFANAEQYAKTRNKDIKRLYQDLGYNKIWPTKPFQGIIYFLIAAALMGLCAAALIYVSWFGFQLTVTVLG